MSETTANGINFVQVKQDLASTSIDNLLKEIERLKDDISELTAENETKTKEYLEQVQDIEILKDKVLELREALRKSNPKYNCGCDDGRSCMFCNGLQHTDDCEYCRLIGGA